MDTNNTMSAENRAYNLIIKALYERRLAPGTALTERSLCDALKVGRTPLRAALKRLSNDGFIVTVPNRGAFVVSSNKQEMLQYYRVKDMLNMSVVRECINLYTENDFNAMETAIRFEEEAFKAMKFQEYLHYIQEFFEIIMQKAENPVLEELHEIVYKRISIRLVLYDDFYMATRDRVLSVRAHFRILDALKKGDADLVERSLKDLSIAIVNNLRFDHIAQANIASVFN